MAKKELRQLLGSVDQHVLLAALRLGENAYAVTIKDQIETAADVSISTGSIYLALDRLERDGLVEARLGEPTAERGGRRKTYFRITARGEDALDAAIKGMKSLARGTSLKGAFT